MQKNLEDYKDEKGFIGHRWDGGPEKLEFGDGCQRISMFYFLSIVLAKTTIERIVLVREWRKIFPLMQLPSGEWTRHWNRSYWWGQSGQMSRDQLTPFICCLAITSDPGLQNFSNNLFKRFGFTWNTLGIWPKPTDKWKPPDWCGPAIWAVFVRGNLKAGRYGIGLRSKFIDNFILPILDVSLLVNSIARIISAIIAPNHTSADKAHFILLLTAKKLSPNLLSEVSEFIYVKFRPKGAAWAFSQYFADEKSPPLDTIMIKALNEVLNGSFR